MRTAEILAFPGAAMPPAPDHRPAPFQPAAPRLSRDLLTIALPEIAHRLGLHRLHPSTIVRHLRTLAAARGFPLPSSARFWQGQLVEGPRAIVAGSLWNRFEVDRWFEDRDPPAVRAARSRHRKQALREEMAGRASAAAVTRRIAASA